MATIYLFDKVCPTKIMELLTHLISYSFGFECLNSNEVYVNVYSNEHAKILESIAETTGLKLEKQ